MPMLLWKMSLKRLKGITEEEITQLQGAQIRNQLDLLEAFDEPEDTPIRSISCATTGVMNENRVAELLKESLNQTSRPLVAGHFRDHWADYLFAFALLLAIIGLVPYLRRTAAKAWDNARDTVPKLLWGEPTPKKEKPTVVAARPIAAFSTLADDDLKISNGTSEQESKRMASLKGRYSMVPIVAGSVIKDEDVSNGKFDCTAVRILRVALKNTPPVDTHYFPRMVDTLFSARDGTHTGAQIPATLLALDPNSNAPSATLAVDPKNIGEMAKWVGSSDIYVLMRP